MMSHETSFFLKPPTFQSTVISSRQIRFISRGIVWDHHDSHLLHDLLVRSLFVSISQNDFIPTKSVKSRTDSHGRNSPLIMIHSFFLINRCPNPVFALFRMSLSFLFLSSFYFPTSPFSFIFFPPRRPPFNFAYDRISTCWEWNEHAKWRIGRNWELEERKMEGKSWRERHLTFWQGKPTRLHIRFEREISETVLIYVFFTTNEIRWREATTLPILAGKPRKAGIIHLKSSNQPGNVVKFTSSWGFYDDLHLYGRGRGRAIKLSTFSSTYCLLTISRLDACWSNIH